MYLLPFGKLSICQEAFPYFLIKNSGIVARFSGFGLIRSLLVKVLVGCLGCVIFSWFGEFDAIASYVQPNFQNFENTNLLALQGVGIRSGRSYPSNGQTSQNIAGASDKKSSSTYPVFTRWCAGIKLFLGGSL
jgi:hypothetical protein